MTTTNLNIDHVHDHLYLLGRGAIWTCKRYDVDVTSRYSGLLVFSCDGSPIDVSTDRRTYSNQVLAIQPGIRHVIHARRGRYCSVRFSPRHPIFRQLVEIQPPGLVTMPRTLLTPFETALQAACLGVLARTEAENLLAGLAEGVSHYLPCARPVDARMGRALRILGENPGCTVGELGAALKVSHNRMSHLFSASMGLPIQTYLRWQRMHCATAQLAADRSLTEIAHAAGYSDVSHFGREIREIAGVSPSRLFKSSRVRVLNWRADSLSSLLPAQRYALPLVS